MGIFSKVFGAGEKQGPVASALRELGSKDERERQRAAALIVGAGPAVIPELISIIENREAEREWQEAARMLGSMDPGIRQEVDDMVWDLNSDSAERVASARKKMKTLHGDGRALVVTVAALNAARERAKVQKESVLGILVEIAVPPDLVDRIAAILIEALFDASSGVSEAAEKALCAYGSSGEPRLLQALETAPVDRRPALINVLQSTGCGGEARELLIRLLHDSPRPVRVQLISLLAAMPGPHGGTIAALIGMPTFREDAAPIRNALGKIGPSDSAELAKGLGHEDALVRSTVAEVLAAAPQGASAALPVLYRLLNDPSETVVRAAAKAIAAIKPDQDGIRALMKALAYDDWEIETSVSTSLASLGQAVVPALIRELKSESDTIRANAVLTLGIMTSEAEAVLPALQSALADKTEFVRRRALAAIGNFETAAAGLAPKLMALWEETGDDAVIDTLCKLREPFAVDLLLNAAFDSPSNGVPAITRSRLRGFMGGSRLTEDIIDWTMQAATYEHKYRGFQHDEGFIALELSDNAIKSLCGAKSPVTSNILHFVARKRDVSVFMDNGSGSSWTHTVSFNSQRSKALSELENRGNPPYEPQLFFQEEERTDAAG